MALKDRVAGLVLKRAEVSSVERLGEHFTRVGLRLRAGTWAPGAKLQVAVDGTTLRAYTPVATDEGAELIAFAHGDGPGARWARTVTPGPVRVFGPRGSLDLTKLESPVVFVGDETSVGLALALHRSLPSLAVRYVFEAVDEAELRTVLDALGLAAEVGTTPAVDADHDLVLSGDGATIKRLRRELPKPRRTLVKTYWAEGRTGLD